MTENMTDFQLKKMLQMVLQILEDSDDIETAKKKIKALLDE